MSAESVQSWLNGLKIAGLALQGAFSVMALLVDYRDKATSKVTKWGRVALCGIAISGAISLTSVLLDSYRAQVEARRAAEVSSAQMHRMERILRQLDRTLHPLKGLEAAIVIKFPEHHAAFTSYLGRLHAEVDNCGFDLRKLESLGIYPQFTTADGRISFLHTAVQDGAD